MRLVTQRLTAAGVGPWIVLDYHVSGWVVGIGVVPSSNGNLTYSVEHTFDDITAKKRAYLQRTTTTATVTLTNHGLSVSDSVMVDGTGDSNVDGYFPVASVTNQNVFTYTVTTGTTIPNMAVNVALGRVFPHATLAAQTTRQNGNYIAPPFAVRLDVTSFTAGYVDMNVILAGINVR